MSALPCDNPYNAWGALDGSASNRMLCAKTHSKSMKQARLPHALLALQKVLLAVSNPAIGWYATGSTQTLQSNWNNPGFTRYGTGSMMVQRNSNLDVEAAEAFLPDPAVAGLKQKLYQLCSGTRNGVDADDATRAKINEIVAALEETRPATPAPTQLPLTGSRHELMYCESQGSSSGKLGPFVGEVEQRFVDDTTFVNAVTLGPLRVELQARRTIKDDKQIEVNFKDIAVSLFGGVELVRKPLKGGGVWRQRFVDCELRIMNTPNLFILRRLEPKEEAPSLFDVLNDPAKYMEDDD